MAKNFISNKDETVRMFKNGFLEKLSHIHYSVPLFIFLPVIGYFGYKSIFVYHLSVLSIFGYIMLGLFIWTLTEYVLHRFVFHWLPPGKIGARLHFIFHGVHHDYPSDSKRLVMVPTVSIPLSALFFYLFKLAIGPVLVAPFFMGFLAGYLFYDMVHYAIHHYNFKSKFWLNLKHHHMLHHYKDMDHGYGVSSKIWDYIFRSDFKKSADQ
ncbi:MAG: sterol desaturase family protein [Bacteroidetes bacterium]|nr:sterol desaturase family protein [Bacteroidota bacterium]MBK8364068.1 sterol desaturase family protein [Bacteroidota bacterium]MBK9413426.1 sterol desaturase family protein [Bacteroidota bacterium]MBL0032581.1 sterol desaturase family protein [Bacteroidota bacterium]MBP6657347.1 sterol desaturase family protein [Bacteroidia bacterium]